LPLASFGQLKKYRIRSMKRTIVTLLLIFTSFSAQALVELDTQFGYNRSVFGSNKESKDVSRTYSASMAFYFLSLTAIEFNYHTSEDETVINYDLTGLTGTYLKSQYQNVSGDRYGVGIRQAFAGQKSFLVPTLSIGWARQKKTSYTNYEIIDTTSDTTYNIKGEKSRNEYDSVFGSFALKIRLTRFLAIKGSITTYFQAFEWNEAKDQLSYMAGLTWMF
jgi:hypothetical protein